MVEQNVYALLLVLLSATSAAVAPVIGPLDAAMVALVLLVVVAVALWTRLGSYLGVRSFAARDPDVRYFPRRAAATISVVLVVVALAVLNPVRGGRSDEQEAKSVPNPYAPTVVGVYVGGGSTLEMNGGSVISSGTGIEVGAGSKARVSGTRVESGVRNGHG